MNKQEIFNTVRDHLLKQNARSESNYANVVGCTDCAYRGANGLKCAVGVLIKDEHYTPEIEGLVPNMRAVATALEKSLGCTLDAQDIIFLDDLQTVHDASEPHEWPEKLREVAARYSLTP